MALSDYRLCDLCGRKTFYDADLHYESGGTLPVGAGAMRVLCEACAATHEIVVLSTPAQHVPKEASDE